MSLQYSNPYAYSYGKVLRHTEASEDQEPKEGFTLRILEEDYYISERADDYRYVVYKTQIQKVRDVPSFMDYHAKNPGSLKHLLTNMLAAQLLTEEHLESMLRCPANAKFPYPSYEVRQEKQSPALSYVVNQMHVPTMVKRVPPTALLELNVNWIQGLIIEAFGAQGFDVIKEAKEKAASEAEQREQTLQEEIKEKQEAIFEQMKKATGMMVGQQSKRNYSVGYIAGNLPGVGSLNHDELTDMLSKVYQATPSPVVFDLPKDNEPDIDADVMADMMNRLSGGLGLPVGKLMGIPNDIQSYVPAMSFFKRRTQSDDPST